MFPGAYRRQESSVTRRREAGVGQISLPALEIHGRRGMDFAVDASRKHISGEAASKRVPGLDGPVASLQRLIDRADSRSRRSKASPAAQRRPRSGGQHRSDTPGSPAKRMAGSLSQKPVASIEIQGAALKSSVGLLQQPCSTLSLSGGLSSSPSELISMDLPALRPKSAPRPRPKSAPLRPRQLQDDMQAAAPELALASKHLELSQEDAQCLLARGLPLGWLACQAEEGEVYYHHTATGTSQWQHPGVSKVTGSLALCRALKKGTSEEPQVQHSVYDARSRHVNLPTPQSLFSEDASQMVTREDLVARAFALHGLLSSAEAASYVQASESHGFHDSDVAREFPNDVRNNSRLIHFSDALAVALWRRLAPHLVHRDIYLIQPMGYGAEGRWKPAGVNPCFRISRYNEGEHFAAHRDGMYVNEDGESSIYSIVLYLNDDFDGGELELPHNTTFKPRTGTALLFPHDTLHTAHAPLCGAKYVARTELMFRCVDAQPAPYEPNFVCDPFFQRMAGLYAQIGDLAALGDAARTTAAYQEALGLQIAHKGTTEVVDAESSRPLPGDLLARTLIFLTSSEVLGTATVSCDWQAATMAGLVWHYRCQQRWPRSQEIIEDTFERLDPEVKDWFGLYKHLHLISMSSTCVCTVFVADQLEAGVSTGGGTEFHSVPARANHTQSGHPWDSSMKHRQGWQVGYTYRELSWFQDGAVNWQMLPELYNHVFRGMKIDPSLHHLLIPAVPGILSKSEQARLSRILMGRFQIPKVSIVPAPLCALLSRNMMTGTVVWGCSMGRSVVSCYVDGEEVLVVGPFNFLSSGPDDIAALLQQASRSLAEDIASRVLENIVFSVHGPATEKQTQWYYGQDEQAEKGERKPPPAWASTKEVRKLLTFNAQLHEHQGGDIVAGGAILAAMSDHLAKCEVKPDATLKDSNSWEWRVLAEGKWHRLPSYCAGVFESALRNGLKRVMVNVGCFKYIAADLDQFTIGLVQHQGCSDMPNTACRLTRFLRGQPSPTPDLRVPDSVQNGIQDEMELLEEVGVTEALHVRTMAGRLVLSMTKIALRKLGSFVQELLEELGSRCHVAPAQLKLLYDGRGLEPDEALELVLETSGSIELLLIVAEKEPDPDQEAMEEVLLEDWPGEGVDLKILERLLYQ